MQMQMQYCTFTKCSWEFLRCRYKRMLQCQDCLQWFHQECIRSLSYQLMFGDRYIFQDIFCGSE